MYNLNLTSNQAFWTQVLVWKDYGGIKKKIWLFSANNVTENTHSTYDGSSKKSWNQSLFKGIVHSKEQIIYSRFSKPEWLSKEHKNILKNVGNQAEFDYHWWPLCGEKHLKIFYFLFHRWKPVIQVWNNLRVRKQFYMKELSFLDELPL